MTFALRVLQPPPSLDASRAPPRSVRISVTDRCDMACVYCRPPLHDACVPGRDRLDVARWETLVRGLMRAGVRRVRITGGEPLLFKDLPELIARLAALGLDDLALTTNGSRLARLAGPLRAAGLRRVTVSVDSLDASRFTRVTRGGDLDAVLDGVRSAVAAGFDEVKTNTVVLRDENDHELAPITEWTWSQGVTPRFIEVMGV